MKMFELVMPLQKTPKGVLETFRLRDGGRNPTKFGDVVQPSTDVGDHYAADLLTGTAGAPQVGALTNLFEQLTLTIHARIRAIGARLTVGAAPVTAGGILSVGWQMPLTGTPAFPVQQATYGVALAGQIVDCGTPLDIVVPAGTIFYALAGGTAAGADHSLQLVLLIENYTGQQG